MGWLTRTSQQGRKRPPIWVKFAVANAMIVIIIGGALLLRWQQERDRDRLAAMAIPPTVAQPPNVAQVAIPTPRPAAPAGLSVSEVTNRAAPGVVMISCLDSRGKEFALGSGFIIDSSGLVATNFHVIRRSSAATATFSDGTKVTITGCRAWDADTDLAILMLNHVPKDAKPVPLAAEESIHPAAPVIAIGHPQGFRFTTTTGIISGVHRTKELPPPYDTEIHAPADNVWLQTSAAISSGSSGGPLLNMNGEVVGVNTWVARGQNLGFAVDVRHVKALAHHLNPELISLQELTGPEERLDAMLADFSTQYEYTRQEAAKSWTAWGAKLYLETKHPALDFLPKFYEFAEQQRGKPAQLEALRAICEVAALPDVPQSCNATLKLAAQRLLNDFRNDDRLISMVLQLAESPLEETSALARRLARESENRRVQGFALYTLALNLEARANQAAASGAAKATAGLDPAASAEAVAALQRIISEFPDVQLGNSDLVTPAADMLFSMQHLAIGRPALEIVGRDCDGKALKLSELRGQIVVLDFWVDWCPHCQHMYPVERALTEKYAGQPFAIVGVNCDEPTRLHRVLADKTVTWRNWPDGPQGSISAAWHVTAFPTLFVLDQNGTIRYRDVRGHDLEVAVAELMKKLPARPADKTQVATGPAAKSSADTAHSSSASSAVKQLSEAPAELRTWTRNDGKTAQLRFLAVEGDHVKLQRPDGRESLVPISVLSPADQDWIRAHAKK